MYQKERIDNILSILKLNGYVSVKYLTEQLHYSTATINRDLNVMVKQGLVTRSYGGVELVKGKGVKLSFRYHLMKPIKNKIGKAAADLVKDGDVIFIDGATTTEYIGKYLLSKKDITVITNNISLISYLSRYKIKCICLGGTIVETPAMLGGMEMVESALKHNADICFFSTGAISDDGIIGGSELYNLFHSIIVKNSKKSYFLADHGKVNVRTTQNLFNLDKVDGIISDYIFSNETKEKYKNTEFIEVE